MAVNLPELDATQLKPVNGIQLATVNAGIKNNGSDDLVLIELAPNSQVAAVYTQNVFCAAPVTVAKQHQQQAQSRYCLINSGNANAGTGQQGLQTAIASCDSVAKQANVKTEQVLPFSTGVIGEQLPLDKIQQAIPELVAGLSADNWFKAAKGIMTTDTQAKGASKQIMLNDELVTITGIAKGSGMIKPNMATMLSYVATDAKVAQDVLQKMVKKAADQSFNRISVDGDTSTNDAFVLMATGQAMTAEIEDIDSTDAQALYEAIVEISQYLAHAIIRDGEGATKFVTVAVEQGRDQAECRQLAETVAHSPLVKTALFASDPNWGRILMAVGRSGLVDFDLTKVSIYLDDVALIEAGEPAPDYTEQRGQDVMNQDDITIKVILGRGQAKDIIWTCDLSYDYVRINAEYRS